MANWGYFLVTLAMFLSFLFVRWRNHLPSMGTPRQLFFLFLINYLWGILWDNFAVSSGHWQYKNMLGLYIGLSPIENLLLAISFPIAAITFYQLVEKKLKQAKKI